MVVEKGNVKFSWILSSICVVPASHVLECSGSQAPGSSVIRVSLFNRKSDLLVVGATDMIRDWLRYRLGDVIWMFLHAVTKSETSLSSYFCTQWHILWDCESLMKCKDSFGKSNQPLSQTKWQVTHRGWLHFLVQSSAGSYLRWL